MLPRRYLRSSLLHDDDPENTVQDIGRGGTEGHILASGVGNGYRLANSALLTTPPASLGF